MLENLADSLRSGRLLATFLPEPDPSTLPLPVGTNVKTQPELQAIAARDWRLRHWGTKWDCGPDGCFLHESEDGSLTCSFDTAWSAPVPFYRTLGELGYDVRAYHLCSGSRLGSVLLCREDLPKRFKRRRVFGEV